jgi:predicted nucleic acid-binding protein
VLGELGLLRLCSPRPPWLRSDGTSPPSSPRPLRSSKEFLRAVPLEIHRPTSHGRERARELADTKDVAILTAAIGAGARLLVTHNVRHLRLGQGVRVVRPRTLMEEVRAWLSSFGT